MTPGEFRRIERLSRVKRELVQDHPLVGEGVPFDDDFPDSFRRRLHLWCGVVGFAARNPATRARGQHSREKHTGDERKRFNDPTQG